MLWKPGGFGQDKFGILKKFIDQIGQNGIILRRMAKDILSILIDLKLIRRQQAFGWTYNSLVSLMTRKLIS